MGHYDLKTHLKEIFRDLAYVRRDDYATLKAKVHRRRNRPPGSQRWRDTWKAFQYELKRRIAEIRAPKSILNLGNAPYVACNLSFDPDQITGRVLAMRMVSRVEWPWHFELPTPAVQLELQLEDRVLFTRAVDPSDAEVRYSLHPDQWLRPAAPLTLTARYDRPLPGVRVEAWLEARLRR
jgi:hypothetical protein